MPAFLIPFLTNPKVWAGLGLALLLAFAGVQTVRLDHAKSDLAAARAAQIDPATKRSWQAEELADAQNLATARANFDQANASLATEQASVAALKAADAADSAKASAAVQQARAATATLSKREAELAALKPAGDACAQADTILSQGATP